LEVGKEVVDLSFRERVQNTLWHERGGGVFLLEDVARSQRRGVPGEVLERKLSSGEGSDESRDNGGFGSFGSRTEGDRGEFVFFAHPQVGIDDGGDKEFAVATVVARKVGADVSPLVEKLVTSTAELAEDCGACFELAFGFFLIEKG